MRAWHVPVVGTLGCLALAARVADARAAPLADLAVGIVGIAGAVPRDREPSVPPGRWAAVTAIGIAAFALARLLMPAHPAGAFPPAAGIVVLLIASVAEEAFFRRWMYGWLAVAGVGPALLGSSAAFAAVHVPIYGLRVLPVDFAAGLLLGWQRLATGAWTASAATHVAANLLQLG